jgi:MoaA/NifB/PqqE/SkfB family radical SAM enzyme
MWTEREIRVIHIEPTDVCQARCAQCARETDPEFDADARHHLRVQQLQHTIPASVLNNLDKVLLCGVYGDPAAGRWTLDLIRWFREHQPEITVGLHSNGGLASTDWWRELATLMIHSQDYVVFSIDGLADTNHIYRRGVSWQRVMQNVEAYISAGGPAHWDMLVYQHNQHQVEQCEQLARDLGFRWFRAKVTRRPMPAELQLPQGWSTPRAGREIRCHALEEASIYIDVQGRVSPCCWLGGRQSGFVTDFTEIQASWHTERPNTVCQEACGSVAGATAFQQQWQKTVEFQPAMINT